MEDAEGAISIREVFDIRSANEWIRGRSSFVFLPAHESPALRFFKEDSLDLRNFYNIVTFEVRRQIFSISFIQS